MLQTTQSEQQPHNASYIEPKPCIFQGNLLRNRTGWTWNRYEFGVNFQVCTIMRACWVSLGARRSPRQLRLTAWESSEALPGELSPRTGLHFHVFNLKSQASSTPGLQGWTHRGTGTRAANWQPGSLGTVTWLESGSTRTDSARRKSGQWL